MIALATLLAIAVVVIIILCICWKCRRSEPINNEQIFEPTHIHNQIGVHEGSFSYLPFGIIIQGIKCLLLKCVLSAYRLKLF